jgi:cytochrome c oxidase assembly protein Cox11
LPKAAQLKVLDEIDKRQRTGELKMIEGEEEFVAVKEGSYWRVFLDWASGLAISFDAAVPPASGLEVSPLTKQTVARPQELFMVAYRVKNSSSQPLTTRIVHRIAPAELKQHLDIVECALLLPVKLSPGQQADFSTTYMVRGDLPDGAKKVAITYDFQIEG